MKKALPLTEELRLGRRDLDGVPGYELISDLTWQPTVTSWTLHFRLKVPVPNDEVRDHDVPETSDWYALISPHYPAGELTICPAADCGITETYPHQTRNLPPREGELWREGVVCVSTPARGFGRHALDGEPRESHLRLRWHIDRTRSWIEAARRGELLREGEPFELPMYATRKSPVVVFDAILADLPQWDTCKERFGFASLTESRCNPRFQAVHSITGVNPDAPPLFCAKWGSFLGENDAGFQHRALWLRTDNIPVVPPWRAPNNWSELSETLAQDGVELMEVLRRLVAKIRDQKLHLLLIGAPIPKRVGHAPALMHWVALQIPKLSTLLKPRKGFRPGEAGAWARDQAQVFLPSRSLVWIPAENWSSDEIATRGRSAHALRTARIVLIGAGAMGSCLAELLIREGCESLTILDGETLAVGNLGRHNLTIEDVGKPKASRLARRLEASNPNARVVGVDLDFPAQPAQEALLAADLVIETTGSDSLLSELHSYDWMGSRLFVSAAVGFYAKRLFLFCARGPTFPISEYAATVDPWLLRERDEIAGQEMPWEGTGCWHPVFPARASDFAMLAGVALRQIEACMHTSEGGYVLHVTERTEHSPGVVELRAAGSVGSET